MKHKAVELSKKKTKNNQKTHQTTKNQKPEGK